MNQEEIRLAIKVYMAANKLRLVDLAKNLECTPAHLSGMLTGKKPLGAKILNYFNVSKEVVFSTTNKDFSVFCLLAKDQIRKDKEARA